MKKSINLLDSLDYLVSHEVTKENCINIKKSALESMKIIRAYILIDEWAKEGKEYFTIQEFKEYEGFADLTDEEKSFQLQALLKESLVYHNDKFYSDNTKLYFSVSYLERLAKNLWKLMSSKSTSIDEVFFYW